MAAHRTRSSVNIGLEPCSRPSPLKISSPKFWCLSNLDKVGINPDLVGIHSLRAGGAMALKLHGKSDTTIMKMGCWSSITFLMYIHNQIGHLSKDLSTRMSQLVPFLNIAAIEE